MEYDYLEEKRSKINICIHKVRVIYYCAHMMN